MIQEAADGNWHVCFCGSSKSPCRSIKSHGRTSRGLHLSLWPHKGRPHASINTLSPPGMAGRGGGGGSVREMDGATANSKQHSGLRSSLSPRTTEHLTSDTTVILDFKSASNVWHVFICGAGRGFRTCECSSSCSFEPIPLLFWFTSLLLVLGERKRKSNLRHLGGNNAGYLSVL